MNWQANLSKLNLSSGYSPGTARAQLQQLARRDLPAVSSQLQARAGELVSSGSTYLAGIWQAAKERIYG